MSLSKVEANKMAEDYKIDQDPAFKLWMRSLIRDRKKRIETMMKNVNKPIIDRDKARILRWMKFVGCKSLTELRELRKRHLDTTQSEWEDDKVTEFSNQLEANVGKNEATRTRSVVRGFYKHMTMSLPQRRALSV